MGRRYLRAKKIIYIVDGCWQVWSKISYAGCLQSATSGMQPVGRNNSKKSIAVVFKFVTDYVSFLGVVLASLNPTDTAFSSLFQFIILVMAALPTVQTYAEVLPMRKERAFAVIPAAYKQAPVDDEIHESKDAVFLRLQDYAFTQGFAVVTTSSPSGARQRYIFQCTRYGKKTRDTRKNTEIIASGDVVDYRKRLNSNVNANECLYKVKFRFYKGDAIWRLTVLDDYYNHPMVDNPFDFKEHYRRDLDRQPAYEKA